jgi:hypothetical protein
VLVHDAVNFRLNPRRRRRIDHASSARVCVSPRVDLSRDDTGV